VLLGLRLLPAWELLLAAPILLLTGGGPSHGVLLTT